MALLCQVTACGPTEDAVEARLGLLVEENTRHGLVTKRVVRMAVEEVNAAGGLRVGGRRLTLSLAEAAPFSNPEEATREALRLINQERVLALIGPTRSLNAIPVAYVADAARVPMVSPDATHPEVTAGKPYVFRVIFTDPFQGAAMARFARQGLDAADAAVLFDEANDYSRSLAEAFRGAFAAAGGEVAVFAGYVPGDQEWKAPLVEVRERRPAVLFLPNFHDAVLAQARHVRRLGIEATMLGGDSWSPSLLAEHPELDGSYLSAPWHHSAATDDPRTKALFDGYRRRWGEMPAYNAPVLAYDAAGVILEALTRARRPEPEAVQEELAKLADYPGVSGPITFQGTGGDSPKQGVILQLRDGEARFVRRLAPSSGDGSSR